MHDWRYVKCSTYIVLIILYSYSSASISWISTPVWPWWKNGFNRIPSSSGSRCSLPKLESLQATYTKLLHWTTQLLKEMSWNERNKEKQRPVHKIILHISVKNVLKSVYTWYPYCSEWSIIVGKKIQHRFCGQDIPSETVWYPGFVLEYDEQEKHHIIMRARKSCSASIWQ